MEYRSVRLAPVASVLLLTLHLLGTTVISANQQGGSISRIDTATQRERSRIEVGRTPVQVASARDRIYVSLSVDSNPIQVAVSPDERTLVAANQGTKEAPGHTVSLIDTRTYDVATVVVPAGPHGVAISRDGTSPMSAMRLRIVDQYSVGASPNGISAF